MRLYGYWRSSSTWRVRIALAWKRVAYDVVPVDLIKDGGEQLGVAHRARNPLAEVPVLELDDGARLTQSLAILEYLEEVHPEPPLLPRAPLERARARQLAEVVNAGVQPLQNPALLRRVEAVGGERQAFARASIERGLDALVVLAAPGAGRYLVGDAPSFADLCLIPQLYNARRFGLDVAAWPLLAGVEAACAELPAFQAAHPDRQPDAAP